MFEVFDGRAVSRTALRSPSKPLVLSAVKRKPVPPLGRSAEHTCLHAGCWAEQFESVPSVRGAARRQVARVGPPRLVSIILSLFRCI